MGCKYCLTTRQWAARQGAQQNTRQLQYGLLPLGFNGKEGGIQFERYKFPVVPAWGVTIHKVQGISLDKAIINLGSTILDHGHAYVALIS